MQVYKVSARYTLYALSARGGLTRCYTNDATRRENKRRHAVLNFPSIYHPTKIPTRARENRRHYPAVRNIDLRESEILSRAAGK